MEALGGRVARRLRSRIAVFLVKSVIPPLAWPALIATAYYLLVIAAALRWHGRSADPKRPFTPPVSVLKPVRGRDPRFYEAIRSHATIDYPEYEVLFGVQDPADPALDDIRRLIAEFPGGRLRIVMVDPAMPNAKVGVLADLAREAKYETLLVNDGDIAVEPDYLRQVIAPLADPAIGVVTCLYRARASNLPTLWEAIGIATDFTAGVLVAPLAGIGEFALGSTMAFRAEDLRRIGGFAAVGDYLADDYQLGSRITALGKHVVLSSVVVETNLSGATWGDVWRHQLRWSRTIRVSRTAGYYGYVVTQAAVWAAAAASAGAWWIAGAAVAVRTIAGLAVGYGVLRDSQVVRWFFLIPLRDLWGFGVWLRGLTGNTVEWRGDVLRLTRDGKIAPRTR